ncbi:MAG TPA: AAA family ATPase, partial [Synergistaceae bacterium]|nr:AAA family ATPase [Synergistaceae bacterium]
MKNIRPRLSYYRKTLADAGRQNPDIKKLLEGKLLFRRFREEFLAGRVEDQEGVESFLSSLSDKKDSSSQEKKDGEMQPVSGILCPWIYMPQVSHGAASGGVPFALLCIPALLSPEGFLQPTGEKPWIPRTILQPLNSEGVTVGSVEDSDTFLTSLESGEIQSWEDLMGVSARYLAQVTGSQSPPNIGGYRLDDEGGFFWEDSPRGTASVHVEKLYNALLEEKSASFPLLERLIEGSSRSLPLLSQAEETKISSRHMGCMSPEFPLSPSQRTALHHFMISPPGELLALNGPPGTGKTTMLQSVVAHLWVEAAVERRECPLMVASSTNNQAVTNIIDSFGKVKALQEDPLYQRWVPDIKSFGLQMARENRWKEAYHSYDNKKQTVGIFGEIENHEWLAKAEAFFLEQASQRYGALGSLASAIESIHRELQGCARAMENLLQGVLSFAPSSPHISLEEEYRQRIQGLEEDLKGAEKALAQSRQDLESTREMEILWEKHLSS